MGEFKYAGSELDLFATARNWKSYWSSKIRPFIRGDVVEVGAGIGSNTPFLDHGPRRRWVCLEPDESLIAQIPDNLVETQPGKVERVPGTLQSLGSERFDTIIYIDVLEHISDDKGELEKASSILQEHGRAIVLSPAHQFLYTPFDAAIGHYRRYNATMLRSLTPADMQIEHMFYLDSAGMILSFANRVFLKQSMPTVQQLSFWDRCVIPVSRITDSVALRFAGKIHRRNLEEELESRVERGMTQKPELSNQFILILLQSAHFKSKGLAN